MNRPYPGGANPTQLQTATRPASRPFASTSGSAALCSLYPAISDPMVPPAPAKAVVAKTHQMSEKRKSARYRPRAPAPLPYVGCEAALATTEPPLKPNQQNA